MLKRFKEVGIFASVFAILWILFKIITFILKWFPKTNFLKNISERVLEARIQKIKPFVFLLLHNLSYFNPHKYVFNKLIIFKLIVGGFKISKRLFLKHRLDDVWKVISSKEALELFHPYCLQNRVVSWGDVKVDEIIYLNGLTFVREFTGGQITGLN